MRLAFGEVQATDKQQMGWGAPEDLWAELGEGKKTGGYRSKTAKLSSRRENAQVHWRHREGEETSSS